MRGLNFCVITVVTSDAVRVGGSEASDFASKSNGWMMMNEQKPLMPSAFGAIGMTPRQSLPYGLLYGTFLGLAGLLPFLMTGPAQAAPGQKMLDMKPHVGVFIAGEQQKPAAPLFHLTQGQPNKDFFLLGDISGAPGEPLNLNLDLPADADQTYSFLMVRGLPEDFKLSAGFKTKNYWAVSLSDANAVQILPADRYSGNFQLEVLIVKKVGSNPARGIANVQIGLPSAVPTTATAPTTLPNDKPPAVIQAKPAAPAAPPPSGLSGITPEETAMLERGNRLLLSGDVASARLLYERVARLGLSEGAIAMAGTYDPIILETIPVAGMRPDVDLAIKWYKTAEALGSSVAKSRLLALESPVSRR